MKKLFENWRQYLYEDLYYGTSTVFRDKLLQEGIEAPSVWSDYGTAESKAYEIVNKFGGEPMVVNMSLSQFEKKHLTLHENYAKLSGTSNLVPTKYYTYSNKLFINIELKQKINLI